MTPANHRDVSSYSDSDGYERSIRSTILVDEAGIIRIYLRVAVSRTSFILDFCSISESWRD